MRIDSYIPEFSVSVSAVPRRDRWFLLILAMGLVLHAWIVWRAVGEPTGAEMPSWMMPDSSSYLANARMFLQGRPLSPVFRERLLLPLMIASVTSLGLPPQSVLWIIWLLHLPAIMAVIYLARSLSNSIWAPRVSAVLYLLWPAVFASGVQVGTDMLHAQLVLIATAATVRWAKRGDKQMYASMFAWILVQLVRPSFYPAALVLLPFLVRLVRAPGCRVRTVFVFVLSLTLIPTTFTILNKIQYGIAAPSLAGVESLHRNVVARIRALQRNQREPGPMTEYFVHEREVIATEDTDWQSLAIYRAGSVEPGFATHYRNLQERGRSFVASNRAWFVRSSLMEVENQLRRVHGVPGLAVSAGGTARTEQWLLRVQKVALLLALLGWACALRTAFPYAVFLALCGALILSACSMLWWESSRIRMPLEALSIPCIAAFLPRRDSLLTLAGIVLVGWAPIRLFGWSEVWLVGIVALAMLGLYLRSSGHSQVSVCG